MKKVPQVLRETFHKCLMKMTSVQASLFPDHIGLNIFPSDRENYKNTRILRDLFREIIQRRRKTPENELKEMGDFLSILLTDDLFKDDEELILDECLTFFFAGS